MKSPYFPHPFDEQAGWYQNMREEIAGRGPRLGFLPTEITEVQNQCDVAVFCLTQVRALEADFGKSVTAYVQAQLYGANVTLPPPAVTMPVWPTPPAAVVGEGIDARRQEWVRRIKASPSYDPLVDGAALRVEPTGDPFNPVDYHAVIRSAQPSGPGTVRLVLAKANGAIDGNQVRMRRTPQSAWTNLGNFTSAEVFDRTPLLAAGQAETREYEVQGVIADALIGHTSDIKTVVVPA